MASTYISRAASGSVTSQTTFTFSFWVKKCKNGANQIVFMHENASTHTQKFELRFHNDDTFRIETYNGSQEYNVISPRKFRDVNAWYHFVVRVDTTQYTESDRYRIYVNGEQISLTEAGHGYPAQNATFNLGSKIIVYGRYQAASPDNYLDGVLSHAHYCDGYSYAPTEFGETDSTTGEWKIKTSPNVQYGSNGHFILKDGNSVTDQSPNTNNFTVSAGTLTKTEDCPSNVFATLNPLHPSLNTSRVFTTGNNTIELGGTGRVPEVSTLGMTTGKFYAEAQRTGGSGGNILLGITGQMRRASAVDWLGSKIYDFAYYGSSGDKANNASETSFGNSFGTGDIVGIAVDLDNNKIYFSKNGTWQNSGDPTSGSTGTGSAFDITAPSSTVDGVYFFACSDDNAYASRTIAWNFGNGYFGTTAVSSAGTNASGNGIFEYNVPTGYTALSTKGLNL